MKGAREDAKTRSPVRDAVGTPRLPHFALSWRLFVSCASLSGCMDWSLIDRNPPVAERCNGLDDDRDGVVDDGFPDVDGDGVPDCRDVETCDGRDNDGDALIDEGYLDVDEDGIPDCLDVEDCDGRDNDGDGLIDEGFGDTDADGLPDCLDAEACDGLDNDGDGLFDEDFPDVDGDGVADCVDTTCTVAVPDAGTVAVRSECDLGPTTPVEDPWRVRVKWQWTGWSEDPSFRHVVALPLVGRTLEDQLGVQVVVVAHNGGAPAESSGVLVRLDGETGSELGTARPTLKFRTGALWTPRGQDIATYIGWSTRDTLMSVSGEQLTISASATHEQYCRPENAIALGHVGEQPVLHACYETWAADNLSNRGAVAFSGTLSPPAQFFAHPWSRGPDSAWLGSSQMLVAPGGAELQLLSMTRSTSWTLPMAISDDEAPILLAGPSHRGDIYLLHPESPSAPRAWTSDLLPFANLPCVGDIDGDGRSEVVIPSAYEVAAYDLLGRRRWSVWGEDPSSAAACSLYDLDGDGAMEVLHAGQDAFRILDGRTGAERFVDWEHSSWTAIEYPVIADVDVDGQAEIVVVSNEDTIVPEIWSDPTRTRAGVTVYEHDGDGWASAEPGWPVWHWARRDVDYRGQVITEEVPWTQEHNLLRAGPMPAISRPELSVRVVDGCVAACGPEGVVQLAVEVANAGVVDAPATWVTVWQERGGDWVPALTVNLGPLAAGARRSHALDTTLGEGALRVRVNDDGSGALAHECDLTNNEDRWEAAVCAP